MKNAFKSNSRFAVLAEETKNNNPFNKKDKNKLNENKLNENEVKKEGNCFTSNSNNSFNNSFNSYERRPINRDFESVKSKELREKQEKEKEERRKKILQEEKEKSLAVENFPDLLGNINNTINTTDLILTQITQKDFIEKVKFIKPIIESKIPENNIKPGWIEIKHDPKTRKVITTSNLQFNCIDSDNNNYVYVLDSLADLHERRTKEYIDMWGYDTWEKMFTSPNYDYDYFNKLDEQYQEEMERIANENEIDNESYYSN